MTVRRLYTTLAFIFLTLVLLGARVAHIQVFKGLQYGKMAENQFVKKVKTESYRGDILDRNGACLATTVESDSVYVRPKEWVRSAESTRFLKSVCPDFKSKLSSGGEFVWVSRKLDPSQTETLARMKFKGIGIVPEQKRYYPNGTLAAHLLGAVGLDHHGLSGIERAFDSFLRGKMVVLNRVRDGKGRNIPTMEHQESSSSGNSIVLTIDRSLQYVAEKEIRRGVEENRAKSGMIVIQNPNSGEILAMAAYPDFDPNELSVGRVSKNFQIGLLQNPIVSKIYEPGSTFKLVAFCAALEEKKFSLEDVIHCEKGKWKYRGITINDHEPQKDLSFSQVLELSSNIGTAKIGLKLGKESFYKYMRAFGFGSLTGVSLPSETPGMMRAPKGWSEVSLPVLSFGQEVGVSAIQIVSAYSAIANGGTLMEPMIIKELNGFENGESVKKIFEPQAVRRVVSMQTAETVKSILGQAVLRGTGDQAKVSGYLVAGKTGTAQKFDPKTKKYFPDKYVSSFCGFAPADNPQIVCYVVLDEPRRDYWGGTTAAPVFSRVVSRVMNILGIPPQSGPILLAQKT